MAIVYYLLAIASTMNCLLYQLDVQNAFLYGDFDEKVLHIPPRGVLCKGEHFACTLNKSLLGFKHASRQWFAKFSYTLIDANFMHSFVDYSLFIKFCANEITIVLVYVYDIKVVGDNPKLLSI